MMVRRHSRNVPSDEADARPAGTDETIDRALTVRTAGFLAVAFLALAFFGAATAGVLTSVGPYLLGVSALVLALFALGWR
jgi:hypothetical protein